MFPWRPSQRTCTTRCADCGGIEGLRRPLSWQKTSTSFEQMAAYGIRIVTLSSNDQSSTAERVGVCGCSGNLFAALGVRPAAGCLFLPEEDRFGAPRVAVINYDLRQRQYAGSTDVIGSDVNRLVPLQGLKPAVAGVAPGLVAAAFASRILRSQLFGVTPVDPLTFVLVPAFLLAAALACLLPAGRATRLDPTAALRAE